MPERQAIDQISNPPHPGGMAQMEDRAPIYTGAPAESVTKIPFDLVDSPMERVTPIPFDLVDSTVEHVQIKQAEVPLAPPIDNLATRTFDILHPEPDMVAIPKKAFVPEVVKKGEYHPGYCQEMLQFFDREKYRTISEEYVYKSGFIETKNKRVPNAPPEFSEFARRIGVSKSKLMSWRKHPEFAEAYEICADIYEEFLVHHGLLGNYGAITMKFVAVNRTKMKDKQETTTRTIDLNEVLNQIAAGKVRPGGLLDDPENQELLEN